jgi:hypothetical protein
MDVEKTAVNRRIRAWMDSFFKEHLPDIFEGWPESAREDVLDALGKRVEAVSWHTKAPGYGVSQEDYQKQKSEFKSTKDLAEGLRNSLGSLGYKNAKPQLLEISTDLKELSKDSRDQIKRKESGIVDALQKDALNTERKRVEYQKEVQKQNGINEKPALLIQVQSGLMIREGYHRIYAAYLDAKMNNRDKFKIKAYVSDTRNIIEKAADALYRFLNRNSKESSMIAKRLDDIAEALESRGLSKMATSLDTVSNGLEEALLVNNFISKGYKIYVDMDGVLCDFISQYKGITGVDLSKQDHWEVDDRILLDSTFWTTMEWMPDGKELWSFVSKFNPCILSAPGDSKEISEPSKRLWVSLNINPNVPVILEDDKFKHATPKSILIDDYDKNIKLWKKHKGIAIKHTSTENTLKELKKVLGGI